MITKLGKEIEEDKRKYAEEKVASVQRKIIRNLLGKGFDSTDIAQIVEDLSINQINKIRLCHIKKLIKLEKPLWQRDCRSS